MSGIRAKEEWGFESNQVLRFLEESCVLDSKKESSVYVKDLFNAYQTWADDNGIKRPITNSASFARKVRHA